MSALAKYDQARQALAACRSVDEIKDIRDKSEAMRLYAKQAQDTELEQWAAEIKLRAQRAIGEISAALEKQKNQAALPTGGKSKSEALADAGISTSTANRYEKLAAIPEPVIEEIIAKSKDAGKPVSAKAVLAEVAPPAPRAAAAPAQAVSPADAPAPAVAASAVAALAVAAPLENTDAPDFGAPPPAAPVVASLDTMADPHDADAPDTVELLIAAEHKIEQLEAEAVELRARVAMLEGGDLAAKIVKLEEDVRIAADRAKRRHDEFTEANNTAIRRKKRLDDIRRAAGLAKDVDLVDWARQATRRAA